MSDEVAERARVAVDWWLTHDATRETRMRGDITIGDLDALLAERACLLAIKDAAVEWTDAEDGDDPIEKCDGYMATREAISAYNRLSALPEDQTP